MEYRTLITEPAARDMLEAFSYISEILHEPRAARRFYAQMKKSIDSLSVMPQRHRMVFEQPYASMGVRRLPVQEYVILYLVEEETATVYILRVLYGRREWQQLLGQDFQS